MMRNHLLYTSAALLLACGDDQPGSPTETTSGTTTSTPSTSSTDPTVLTTSPQTETDATTETETTTGPMGCVDNSECTDAASPLCIDEVCEPCGNATDGDAGCVELDAAMPVSAPAGSGVRSRSRL